MIKSCMAAMGALTILSARAFADYDIVQGAFLVWGARLRQISTAQMSAAM
jgi:hypothetical protein